MARHPLSCRAKCKGKWSFSPPLQQGAAGMRTTKPTVDAPRYAQHSTRNGVLERREADQRPNRYYMNACRGDNALYGACGAPLSSVEDESIGARPGTDALDPVSRRQRSGTCAAVARTREVELRSTALPRRGNHRPHATDARTRVAAASAGRWNMEIRCRRSFPASFERALKVRKPPLPAKSGHLRARSCEDRGSAASPRVSEFW